MSYVAFGIPRTGAGPAIHRKMSKGCQRSEDKAASIQKAWPHESAAQPLSFVRAADTGDGTMFRHRSLRREISARRGEILRGKQGLVVRPH